MGVGVTLAGEGVGGMSRDIFVGIGGREGVYCHGWGCRGGESVGNVSASEEQRVSISRMTLGADGVLRLGVGIVTACGWCPAVGGRNSDSVMKIVTKQYQE